MKKILAIIFLLASCILLGGYFNETNGGQLTPLSKEMNGLYTKIYITHEDFSTLNVGQFPDNVQLYGEDIGGVSYIYVVNPYSTVDEGIPYKFETTNETVKVGDDHYHIYRLSELKGNANYYLILSSVCMILFLLFMLWGAKLTKKSEN